MKCVSCDRECTNLKDGICCLERSMNPYLFGNVEELRKGIEEKLCSNCSGQKESIEEKMEELSK